MGCGGQTNVQGAGGGPEGTMCGKHLKSWEDLKTMPYFPGGCKSHLMRALTPAVWNQLKDKKDKWGFPFKHAIFAACKYTHLGMGVFAGSHDSYTSFAPLMDKIILSYHGHDKTAKHPSNMNYRELKCPPFSKDEDAMINSTRIRVGRNLAAYPLGSMVTKEQRREVETLITSALSEMTGDLKGTYYPLTGMNKADSDKLEADHFLFHSGKDNTESSGLERHWPDGRGIFHNDKKTFLCWINEEDQLRIISMQPGSDIGEVFSRLAKAAAKIEEKADFAQDEHLGYITSCPTNLGTGLRASVHIHLPKLGKDMDRFEDIAAKFNVQVRGAHGEHTNTDDGIFDISNSRRLGRTEVQLVQDMYDGVKMMIAAEKSL